MVSLTETKNHPVPFIFVTTAAVTGAQVIVLMLRQELVILVALHSTDV